MKIRNVILTWLVLFVLFFCGCTGNRALDAQLGGVIGATAGSIIYPGHPMRGAILGAAIGAVAGITISEIYTQVAREAARRNEPVYYDDRRGNVIQAVPVSYDSFDRCRVIKVIHNKVIEDGRLIADNVQEVCVPN
jgi:hypothetical protein